MKKPLSISRRTLLKATGAAALGIIPAGTLLVRAAGKPHPKALQAKSWAMVINAKLCPPGCRIRGSHDPANAFLVSAQKPHVPGR